MDNIDTDNRYTLAMAHVLGQLYKQSGLLTSEGKIIKNKHEIVQLIEVIWLPTGHNSLARSEKKDKNPQIQVNKQADQVTKRLLFGNPNPRLSWNHLLSMPLLSLNEEVPKHDPEEIKSCSDLGAQGNCKAW